MLVVTMDIPIALGTAYLAQHREDFIGTVKIIFQPAEEGPGGAKPMIEAGVLKNPDVDAIVGLHLWNNLPLGTVGVRSGALMAAVECFRAAHILKRGHGAMPHQTVDSVVVAAQVVTALQTVAHNVDPLGCGSYYRRTPCRDCAQRTLIQQVKWHGTLFNPALGEFIAQQIEQVIAGVCQSQERVTSSITGGFIHRCSMIRA